MTGWHDVVAYAHVLLLVFWLGTDVGVFLAAKISERATLSVETRATVLGLGMVLDRLPRSALVLIVPTGLVLAANLGLTDPPAAVIAGIWVLAAVWLAILWAGFLNPQTTIEKTAMLVNLGLSAVAALLVGGWGVLLLGDESVPTWLAIKVLTVGLIFAAGVVLDILFRPAVEAFAAILADGASPERDRAYSKSLAPVYIVVIAIYVLVAIAAWFGLNPS